MNLIWIPLALFAAFYWFACACGFLQPDPWMVKFAFAMCGLDMVISALKSAAQ